MKKFLVIVFLLFPSVVFATTYMVDCSSSTTVQNQITSAAVGDTVKCNASGTYTWSPVNVSGRTLDLNGSTINGSGNQTTAIVNLNSSSSGNSRLTCGGGTMTGGGAVIIGGGKTAYWSRVDHCIFTASNTVIYTYDQALAVIDANEFHITGVSEIIHQMAYGTGSTTGWTNTVIPGGADMVFIENNKFYFDGNPATSGAASAAQAYYGARTVFRFNDVLAMKFDNHGTPNSVGGRWWEIYNNAWTGASGGNLDKAVALRAGSGVVFNNTWTSNGSFLGYGVGMYEEDTGTYPLAYQVGRGINNTSDPAYLWGNSSNFNIAGDTVIVAGRDYMLSQKTPYTPYNCPHDAVGTGSCNYASSGTAAYLVSSNTTTAISCAALDIQTAINNASDGYTVVVPACPSGATWTSAVSTNNKKITLQGAGIGQTVLTLSDTNRLNVTNNVGQTFTLTGFTIKGQALLNGLIKLTGSVADFRIHDNYFEWTSCGTNACVPDGMIYINGLAKGVIDHNTFAPTTIQSYRSAIHVEADSTVNAYGRASILGTQNVVTIETNTFTQPQHMGYTHAVWAQNGGSFVFRNNNVTNWSIDMHGPCSSGGGREFEIYNNVFTATADYNGATFVLRGGTGVLYNNTMTSGGHRMYGWGMWLQEVTQGGSTCVCPSNTYPHNYQLGRGTSNALDPIGFWNNKLDGSYWQTNPSSQYSMYLYDPYSVDTIWFDGPAASGSCSGLPDENYFVQYGRDFTDSASTPKVGYTALIYPHPLVESAPTGTIVVTQTVIGGNGSLSCTSPVIYGNLTYCTAYPNTNYYLSNVTSNCSNLVWSNPAIPQFTAGPLTANCQVTVTFSLNPDTTAPVISGASPSGSFSFGTQSVTMSVNTNESANCRYSLTDTVYSNMTNTFYNTGGTTHTQPFAVTSGNSYTYYVRCVDASGNTNNSSTSVSWSVQSFYPNRLKGNRWGRGGKVN